MVKQLIISSLATGFVVLIHAEMLALYEHFASRLVIWLQPFNGKVRYRGMMVGSVFWVLVAMTLETWLWAGVLLYTGAVQTVEGAVYFSLVCFTTLGFGDIILAKEWRILSSMIAVNGMLIFGWSTAFMFEVMRENYKHRR